MQPCMCHGVRTAGNATAVAGKNGGASLRYGRVFLIIIYPDFNPFFGSMFFPLKNMLTVNTMPYGISRLALRECAGAAAFF